MPEESRLGVLGESLTCRLLKKRGYTIVARNYRKPCGEIDIVAELSGVIHFVEVKAVSREPGWDKYRDIGPEENLHKHKIARLERVIQAYLQENGGRGERRWQLDAALVHIDRASKEADIEILEGIG